MGQIKLVLNDYILLLVVSREWRI